MLWGLLTFWLFYISGACISISLKKKPAPGQLPHNFISRILFLVEVFLTGFMCIVVSVWVTGVKLELEWGIPLGSLLFGFIVNWAKKREE